MTLAEAEAAERAAVRDIGALGERELTAVKLWIAGNCEGPRPQPDAEARRVLADRLTAAMAAREAADRAVGGRGVADGSVARRDCEIAATGARCGAATAV
jgi:hypothetical protein